MHNLHYLVIEAETGKEACDNAESAVESFGDENNWRTVCGAVCSTGEVYKGEEGRWDTTSLKEIQETAKGWLFDVDDFHKKGFDEAIADLANGKILDGHQWYCVKKYAEEQGDKSWALMTIKGRPAVTPESFDIFKHGYRDWKLTECGVTHLGEFDAETKKDRKNLWVVLLDMHS
jgi:hypothetical protein